MDGRRDEVGTEQNRRRKTKEKGEEKRRRERWGWREGEERKSGGNRNTEAAMTEKWQPPVATLFFTFSGTERESSVNCEFGLQSFIQDCIKDCNSDYSPLYRTV